MKMWLFGIAVWAAALGGVLYLAPRNELDSGADSAAVVVGIEPEAVPEAPASVLPMAVVDVLELSSLLDSPREASVESEPPSEPGTPLPTSVSMTRSSPPAPIPPASEFEAAVTP